MYALFHYDTYTFVAIEFFILFSLLQQIFHENISTFKKMILISIFHGQTLNGTANLVTSFNSNSGN